MNHSQPALLLLLLLIMLLSKAWALWWVIYLFILRLYFQLVTLIVWIIINIVIYFIICICRIHTTVHVVTIRTQGCRRWPPWWPETRRRSIGAASPACRTRCGMIKAVTTLIVVQLRVLLILSLVAANLYMRYIISHDFNNQHAWQFWQFIVKNFKSIIIYIHTLTFWFVLVY